MALCDTSPRGEVSHSELGRWAGEAAPRPAMAASDAKSRGGCCVFPPHVGETNLIRILGEIYNPKVLAFKCIPTALLRVEKAFALVINQAVGQAFCGWKKSESRLYDHVGAQCAELCRALYGAEITEELVFAFLRRRFMFCGVTATVSAIQIALQLADIPEWNVLLSVALFPLTLVDRQFATLVTKMSPRYQRSLMLCVLPPYACCRESYISSDACVSLQPYVCLAV